MTIETSAICPTTNCRNGLDNVKNCVLSIRVQLQLISKCCWTLSWKRSLDGIENFIVRRLAEGFSVK